MSANKVIAEAYTPAKASSSMTPMEECLLSAQFIGHGFKISKIRKNIKEQSQRYGEDALSSKLKAQIAKDVGRYDIHCPTTSSITTSFGSEGRE
tara:strand:+ start:397 stop:678 length:282 start_codon:yes stop_codon:yes gene_type:complete